MREVERTRREFVSTVAKAAVIFSAKLNKQDMDLMEEIHELRAKVVELNKLVDDKRTALNHVWAKVHALENQAHDWFREAKDPLLTPKTVCYACGNST